MTATCPHLEPVVADAAACGVAVAQRSSGWAGAVACIAHMDGPLPAAIRARVTGAAAPLRYYAHPGDPHTAPDEGLLCEACGMGLSFPVAKPRGRSR